jgi:predicted Zn-dependent peptidase
MVVRQLDDSLRQLRERPPDAQKLEAARSRVIRAYPVMFETVRLIASSYAEAVVGDLPLASFNEFQASAAALTWDQIRSELPPADQMRLVVVGDLKGVRPALLSLGWGPIEVHDTDGRLVK